VLQEPIPESLPELVSVKELIHAAEKEVSVFTANCEVPRQNKQIAVKIE
jgi:hypothetical protein